MYPGDGSAGEDIFYYLTLYNENYPMPPMPDDESRRQSNAESSRACTAGRPAPEGDGPEATMLFSGTAWAAATEARDLLAEHYGVRASLWSATSYQRLRMEAMEARALEPPAPPRSAAHPAGDRASWPPAPGPSWPSPTTCGPFRTRSVVGSREGRRFTSLGTDGFGRSDTREELRRFFETDAAHVIGRGARANSRRQGSVPSSAVADAIVRLGLDPDAPASWLV